MIYSKAVNKLELISLDRCSCSCCLNTGFALNLMRFQGIPCSSNDCLAIDIVLAANWHVDIRSANNFSLCFLCFPQSEECPFAADFTASSQLGYGISNGYYVKNRTKAPSAKCKCGFPS